MQTGWREAALARILLAGDTHRNLRHTLWLIDQAADLRCASLFVLGDFAYRMDDGGQWFIQEVGDAAVDAGILVHWLDGNHDDHDWLDDVRADDCTDDDGFLVSGMSPSATPTAVTAGRGAARLRRPRRGALGRPASPAPHVSWWPQETITAADVDRCLDGGPLDVLLTHDAPTASPVAAVMAERGAATPIARTPEANRRAVEQVRRATTPGVVAHGHYHLRYTLPLPTGGRPLDSDTTDRGHDSRVLFDTRHFDPAALRPPTYKHDDPQRTGCRDPGRDGVAVPR